MRCMGRLRVLLCLFGVLLQLLAPISSLGTGAPVSIRQGRC
jgi:hypothetical protein